MTVFKKKNILLINPWIYDFAAYDLWVKPLGLLYIAGLLRANGYAVHLIDCLNARHPKLESCHEIRLPKRYITGHGNFPKQTIPKPQSLKGIKRNYNRYGITSDILTNELNSSDSPHLIFVTSMMTYWYPGVFEVIRLAKQTFPGVPIVLGGIYATLCPEHAITSGADIIVTGAGEKQLSALLHKFFGDDVLYAPDPDDLDSLPYPALDLLPLKDQFPILTSRGCPYSCTYCASGLLTDNFRQRNHAKIVDEIQFWHEHFGVSQFSIYDDALLVNPHERAIPMLKEIIGRGLNCRFHCPNGLHISQVTPELSKLMYMAGFTTMRFGFESSNPLTQLSTGGKVNNDQLQAGVRYLMEAGYKSEDIGIYLLCGLPGQEATEVRESIRHVQSCGARPIIAEYSPIPGTALWESAVNASHFDLKGEPLFHNNSLLPCSSEKLTPQMYEDLKIMSRAH
ncbi:MAG: B12-binding domain-containing radical SAM protein [Syntrophales bacterium]